MTLDRIFVYGTLKVGESNHALIAPFLRDVRPGSVPGNLVRLGGYPGWVEGEGKVYGEVLRVASPVEALRILDELEEFSGRGHPGNLYERVIASVSTLSGLVSAWAYRYVGPTADVPLIPNGVWHGSRG